VSSGQSSALLIVAADAAPAYRPALDRLLDSLAAQTVPCNVVLALRGDEDAPVARGAMRVHVVRLSRPASLTHSRNAALAFARQAGLLSEAAVVGFPDDDCWYDETTLTNALRGLAQDDVVCGVYGPSRTQLNTNRFPAQPRALSVGRIMNSASSVTMFLTPGAVEAIGDFDETLGVGAVWGSSEDVDYLLRARRRKLSMRYMGTEVFVGHEYKAGNPAAYYPGNVAVLAKHRRDVVVIGYLLRRLLGGLLSVCLGRLPFAAYRKALSALH
jgi:hypothetical protein